MTTTATIAIININFIIYPGRYTHTLVSGHSTVRLLMKYAVIFVGEPHLTNPCVIYRYRTYLTGGKKISPNKYIQNLSYITEVPLHCSDVRKPQALEPARL